LRCQRGHQRAAPDPHDRDSPAIEQSPGAHGRGPAEDNFRPASGLSRLRLGRVDPRDADALAALQTEGVAVDHMTDARPVGWRGSDQQERGAAHR